MNREQIKAMALASGFKLRPQPDGSEDLNPYVYEFAAALTEHMQQQNDYLSALASGQPLYGLEEKIADLMQRNKALREECDQLKAETKRLDAAVGEEISNRDRVEAHADRLADGIAKALGIDFGEHSSSNCPWNNAFFAIDEFDLATRDAEVIERFARELGVFDSEYDDQEYIEVPRHTIKDYANQRRQQAKSQPGNDSCELECGAHGTYCRCRVEKAKEVQS